jgi:hypothetical protein
VSWARRPGTRPSVPIDIRRNRLCGRRSGRGGTPTMRRGRAITGPAPLPCRQGKNTSRPPKKLPLKVKNVLYIMVLSTIRPNWPAAEFRVPKRGRQRIGRGIWYLPLWNTVPASSCASLMVIYLIIDINAFILLYRCKADIRKGTGSIGVQQSEGVTCRRSRGDDGKPRGPKIPVCR